jgi:hypothetical protein
MTTDHRPLTTRVPLTGLDCLNKICGIKPRMCLFVQRDSPDEIADVGLRSDSDQMTIQP